ncbi:hypothetical protein ACET3Z_004013 [Daucus carota]
MKEGSGSLENHSEYYALEKMYNPSFDHPTDTWLAGAKLRTDSLLTSWKNSEDPSSGLFSVRMDVSKDKEYSLIMEWNKSTRLVIDVSGQLKQFNSFRENPLWSTTLVQEPPEAYAICGPYGILNSSVSCECLPGFQQPLSPGLDDFHDGCTREKPLKCENSSSNGKKDEFKRIPNVNVYSNSVLHPAQSMKNCEIACTKSCSCIAYMYHNSKCLVWENILLNLTQVSDGHNNRYDLYVKLAASEKANGGKSIVAWIVSATVASLVALVSGGCLCRFWICKGQDTGKEDLRKDLQYYDFSSSSNATDEKRNKNKLTIAGKRNDELPLFSFKSVSAATENFSVENKLGQGGFGPVYKGKTIAGQEIAIKRLSRRSGQGLEEFRNEIALISKLQHLNLAWKLWNDDRAVELMDPALGSPSSVYTLMRYINIGLLCVQGKPADRPSMSKIIPMLNSDLIPLPAPTEPAFTTNHTVKPEVLLSGGENCTLNGLTVSRIEPR